MDIRYPVHPEHGKKMDTTELRKGIFNSKPFSKR